MHFLNQYAENGTTPEISKKTSPVALLSSTKISDPVTRDKVSEVNIALVRLVDLKVINTCNEIEMHLNLSQIVLFETSVSSRMKRDLFSCF